MNRQVIPMTQNDPITSDLAALKEPMPVMIKACSWEGAKKYFAELRKVLAQRLKPGDEPCL
jgi:hypothetical protein